MLQLRHDAAANGVQRQPDRSLIAEQKDFVPLNIPYKPSSVQSPQVLLTVAEAPKQPAAASSSAIIFLASLLRPNGKAE